MKMELIAGIFLIVLLHACKRSDPIGSLPDLPTYTDSIYLQLFRQSNGITAAQNARSLTLSDGRVLWLFDNAHLNDMNSSNGKISCNSEVSNAAAIQQGMNFTTLNMANSDFIPSNEVANPIQMLHACQFFDTVFVFCKKANPINGYSYIAKLSFPSLQFLQIDSIKTPYQFGYSIVTDTAKGFCYVYGMPFSLSASGNGVYVARMPLNSPHLTWEYYTGIDFVNTHSGLQSVGNSEGSHFSVRKVKNKFVFISMKQSGKCDKAAEVHSAVSIYPYGTFLNQKKIYTVQDNISQYTAVSGFPCLHTFATNSNKELLLTYSIDGFMPCLNTCGANEADPDYHRTKTIRIPMRNVDVEWQ